MELLAISYNGRVGNLPTALSCTFAVWLVEETECSLLRQCSCEGWRKPGSELRILSRNVLEAP
jgi:hypothetical protein